MTAQEMFEKLDFIQLSILNPITKEEEENMEPCAILPKLGIESMLNKARYKKTKHTNIYYKLISIQKLTIKARYLRIACIQHGVGNIGLGY